MLTQLADVVAFHAGTSTVNGKTVTFGGRVLCVSAFASTLQQALNAAYAGVSNITFEGKVFRRDIAHRSVTIVQPEVSVWLDRLFTLLEHFQHRPKLPRA